ncbi:DCC1-like thiol-disulfide oxidoreductase family protein [Natronomonas sp. EA1]|uniref:DCC1-like thiol-disulfide oxidoreductase family protein n=1 Tax=Natronomonas sp. EA1 TaxID=3421655 RepID=UPI003EBF326F
MTDDTREATFVYDDDCGFCTWWADFFAEHSELGLVGFSELTDEEKQQLPENWEACAHLFADGETYSCGEAIERALARADVAPGSEQVFGFLREFKDYERLREILYREAADRRDLLGHFLSKEPPARRD